MSYGLHIERDAASGRGPITLEEWCNAVAATPGVRLVNSDAHMITNPATGEVISIQMRYGDAEVFFPERRVWLVVFVWRGTSIAFADPGEPDEGPDAVWNAAAALARRLEAEIRGDEGEVYDLNASSPARAAPNTRGKPRR